MGFRPQVRRGSPSRRRTIRRSEAFAAFDEPELRDPAAMIEQLAGE
jgi:hypothetical protein